jgi:hypothetical protein
MRITRPTRSTTTGLLSTTCLMKGLLFPGNWRKIKKIREKLNRYYLSAGSFTAEIGRFQVLYHRN